MVSSDEPLAAGVVDALLAQGTSGGRPDARGRGDRVEQGLRPLAARRGRARGGAARCTSSATRPSCSERSPTSAPRRVAVKPAGLTGGKGVKVMGPHLADHDEAREYALELLAERRRGRVGADRGAHRRRRVHDPGDQRRAHGRVPALDLRLPVPLRRRRGSGHRRDGLALAGLADAALHDARALRARRARSSPR